MVRRAAARVEPLGIDTNILVYALFADAPRHSVALSCFEDAVRSRAAVITTQVLAEYYRTITSDRVTAPLIPAEAAEEVRALLADRRLRVLPVRPSTLGAAVDLAARAEVRARRFFDALLAATLIEAGVRRLLTGNARDFRAFPGIEAIDPFGAS